MLIMAITDVLIIIFESLFLGDCISLLERDKAFIDEIKEKYDKAETGEGRRYYKSLIDGRCTPRVIVTMISSIASCVIIHINIFIICIRLQLI